MEYYVVFSNEVDKLGVRALPPFLPAVRKEFLGVGDIAYWRIEPYIQHLAFRALYRDGNAPVQVSGYGTRLQA